MIGQAISRYRIVAKIGEGGMGLVWKAEDTELGRFVALKSLPTSVLDQEHRRARFLREARAASALNHPNIVTVYDLIRGQDSEFLVMEYVDGKTLEHLLHGRGLPLSESLRIGVAIADALAAAHHAGIVHRDLKPGNVMVSSAGTVKVLDFGLVKLLENEACAPADATRTASKTEEGAILGTVSYMSPEQAQGKPVDARTDIFSFGALLYETLTGRRAFQGDNRISTLAAILNNEPPPITETISNLPREVDRLIARCLRKDPAKRWQTMADLKVALEELKEETDSGRLSAAGPAAAAPPPRRWVWTAALAFFLVVCVAGVWLWSHRAASPTTFQKVALTTYAGSERSPSISPDGKYVAFTWDGEKGDNVDVYVKLIDAGEPLRLTRNPAPEYRPRWSPDGRQITYVREGAVFSIAPLGGTEKKLVENVTRGYDWLPSGNRMVAGIAGGLEVIDFSSGTHRRLTGSSQGRIDYNPRVSPDGRHIVFVRILSDQGQQSVFAVPVEGGEARVIASQEGFNQDPAWMPDSREVLFHRQWGPLLRVPFTGGTPMRVPESDESILDMDISAAGNRLIYSKLLIDLNIYSAETGPDAKLRRIIASSRRDLSVAVSPDGQRLAFSSDRGGESAWEIWTSDAEGGAQVQLTSFGKAFADGATWSPDGSEIAFSALIGGNRDIYRINPEGGTPARLTTEPSDDGRPRYSSDGKTIYFRSDRGGRAEIWKMQRGGGPAVQVTSIGGFDAWESTDGKLLYFTKARNTPGLWSMPVSGGEAQPVRGLERARAGLWVPSAAGIHWIDTSSESSSTVMLSTPGRSVAQKLFSLRAPLWHTAPVLSITHDGRRIFWHQADQLTADLVLIDNFR